MPPVLPSIGGSYLLVLHPELTGYLLLPPPRSASLRTAAAREIRPRQNVHAEGWIKSTFSLL